MHTRGILITLEGNEASGKSTQQKIIADYLTAKGIEVVQTREPGGTLLGEQIRNILLNFEAETITPISELLLMFAARVQHVQQVIEPALASGKWIVCDRFIDSSYAYQGGARKLDFAMIEALEAISLKGLVPDITFYLQNDLATSQARQAQRGQTKDRFEKTDADFFHRVEAAFTQRAKQFERIKTIKSQQSPSQISSEIFSYLAEFLPKN